MFVSSFFATVSFCRTGWLAAPLTQSVMLVKVCWPLWPSCTALLMVLCTTEQFTSSPVWPVSANNIHTGWFAYCQVCRQQTIHMVVLTEIHGKSDSVLWLWNFLFYLLMILKTSRWWNPLPLQHSTNEIYIRVWEGVLQILEHYDLLMIVKTSCWCNTRPFQLSTDLNVYSFRMVKTTIGCISPPPPPPLSILHILQMKSMIKLGTWLTACTCMHMPCYVMI